MAYKHGVYNSENDTSLTTPIQGSAGLQVIFGTAPIHLSADPEKAANTPKLCYSFKECQQAVGYSDDFKRFTLCQSIDACFRVFNIAPIILINVLDPNKAAHTTVNETAEYAVRDGIVVYDKEYVMLNTLEVKNAETVMTANVDYTAVHDEDGTVVISLISEDAQKAVNLSISSKSINPDGVTYTDIVGGVDAVSGKETGLELVRHIFPKFGMTPGIILAPGWSHDPIVAAALQARTTSINGNFECNAYIDIAADVTGAIVYTDVKRAKETLGVGNPHAAAFWPMAAIGEKIYRMSAMAAALTAYNDAQNGDVPHESPSNKSMPITATVLADGTEVILDQQQANDMLNANGIITAINFNGFRLWGNNTAAYPSTTDPKDRWLSVRRFFDWDGNNFILTYFQRVDKPGNKRLIHSIVDSQNVIGNGYVARDYCAGYRVEFRDDENPATNLLDGHLTTHTYLAPYIPAEVIENIREFDVNALASAIGGE